MTVRQIARLVGYENEASLSKAFRRAFGHAPGDYRRQQLAAPASGRPPWLAAAASRAISSMMPLTSPDAFS